MSGSQAGATPGDATDTGQVSTQLAQLVPTFDPATDNVDIWTSKVELLVHAWPQNKLIELATRLILGCKGTAYQKLQLNQKELLVNDASGIHKIVELVGGSWGQVPLERKFELAERALYRSSQKMDESSDSYLTRSDVVWTELLSKKVDMSELRAYIVLRNSRLSSEDKKRVIVEAGAERGDALAMSKVTAAIRMLGSNFFLDLTGQKRDKGLKTYDHTAFHVEDQPDPEEAMWVQEDGGLDDQTLEILAAEDDEDAAMILQFEDAVSELVQNDQELCAYFSAYQDARKRLSEKVRFRGFWAVKRGEKGSGKKGKVKGKGKASLARRIANSYCRVCLQKGHWKDECPQRKTADGASGSSNNVMPTSFVTTDVPEAMQNMPTAQVTKHEQKCQQFCIFGVITGNQRHHQGPRLSLFKKQNSGTEPTQFWAQCQRFR